MNGIAWGSLLVGILIGWLVLPMVLGLFRAKGAA